jgi:transposase
MAPSTVGTFLRAFTFGHVRQLDRLTEQVVARAWAAGAGPGDGPMTMDLDSTVCEVHGHATQGAAYGYTHALGYHPLVASRAESGEVLHARQRTGRPNTARGTARFVDELAARVRRAGASGELTMRMDSGFWSAKTIRACRRHQLRYSITVRQTTPIRAAIATIAADAWVDIVYPDGGLAEVAETRYKGDRLIVRRTRLVGAQAELFPNWRYHAFVTDRVGTTVELDQDHRRHAVVELCIRDLEAGAGLRHCPSGKFNANAAWLVIATLAHNLLRNPVDRGKAGSKLHLAGERNGLPVAVVLSAANANDATMFEAVLDDIPPIRMPTGRKRRRPTKVHADKAYDHRRCRRYLRRRGIRPRIARRLIESSERLGRHRWTIERTGAWLGGWRRLRIRYERSSERFYALAMLACAVICFNALQRPP